MSTTNSTTHLDEMGRFMAQNTLAAQTVTPEQAEQADAFAEHHCGGLYVLGAPLGERYVKCHDSWGDEGTVVVHAYDPEDGGTPDDVWHFPTGEQAVARFLDLVEGHPSSRPVEQVIASAVAQAKAEILADIADGTLPDDVATFSALHDHTDANLYGGLCDDDAWGWWCGAGFDASIAVQDQVDAWLVAGRRDGAV